MKCEVRKTILHLMKCAMFDAQKANTLLTSGALDSRKEISSVAFSNSSLSKCMAAQAIYYANYEELVHPEFEELFHLFQTVNAEILTNFSTDHSHQWSDVEFSRLEVAFNRSVCAAPIEV